MNVSSLLRHSKYKYCLYACTAILFGLIVYAVSIYLFLPYPNTPKPTIPKIDFTEIQIKNAKIFAETATTPEAKALGLGNRVILEPNRGMLFDFSKTQNARPTFWMKNMKFNIDIIWIKNSKIVYIHENVPAPENPDSPLPTYTPPQDIDYVLEVNANFCKNQNIQIGDFIKMNILTELN